MFALTDKVASAFAAVEWKLFYTRGPDGRATRALDLERASHADRWKAYAARRQAGELVEATGNLLLTVLHKANVLHTGYEFRKLACLQRDLSGDTFLLKERNGFGAPVALWPIPSHWIMALPTPTAPVYRVAHRGWHGEIPATEFLRISNPNPADPYGRGVGLIGVLADEIETDEYSAKYSRQTFLNQARPDFLVFPKEGQGRQPWGKPETERLEEQWRSEHMGFWRVAKPKFLSREVGVFEFNQTSFRDLQLVQLREFERDAIKTVFGVPPEILGVLGPGSNRATITQASAIFNKLVLVPRLESFRAALQEFLVPEYDDKLLVDYVSPLEADAELELETLKAAPFAATLNEIRARLGLAPLAGPEGNAIALPLTTQLHELRPLTGLSTADLLQLRKLVEDERRR